MPLRHTLTTASIYLAAQFLVGLALDAAAA
jgi:hypothetical protein